MTWNCDVNLTTAPPRGQHTDTEDGTRVTQHLQSYLMVGVGTQTAHLSKYNNKLYQAQTAHTKHHSCLKWAFLLCFCGFIAQQKLNPLTYSTSPLNAQECRPALNWNGQKNPETQTFSISQVCIVFIVKAYGNKSVNILVCFVFKSCGSCGMWPVRWRGCWRGGGGHDPVLQQLYELYLYGRRKADTLLLMRRMKERGSISLDSRVVYLK